MRPLDRLFEDNDYLVVNKPAGVPVHGGAKVRTKTVLERVPGAVPVHRLDVGTSGALLLAKSKSAAASAAADWSDATKIYVAVVVGRMGAATLDAPLPAPDGRPQPAETRVEPVAESPEGDYTLVRAVIRTGRTHQIRRHVAGAGHPIVMDDRHGDFGANKDFRARMRARDLPSPKHPLLHARTLAWRGKRVEAPVPDRWKPWLEAVGLSLP